MLKMERGVPTILGLMTVLVIAIVALSSVDTDEGFREVPVLEDAELKVFGNANLDRHIDLSDLDVIRTLIDVGASVEDHPEADANLDGTIDETDLDVVGAIIAGEPATVWHLNYHDTDGDGVTDTEVVSTQYPVTSAIALGTGNNLMLLYCLGIHEQIKGATYTSSADGGLYGDVYLDESRVVKLGTSMTAIELEGGRVGSSDVISRENVTALVAYDSTLCIDNEDEFEAMGVDVIRVPSSSAVRGDFIHTVMLMGLLFREVGNADAYLEHGLEVFDHVSSALMDAPATTAAVSIMTGRLSVGDSDYIGYLSLIGVGYPLSSGDFGGKKVIAIADHPEIYLQYDFDRIIHARSGLGYGQTPDSNEDNRRKYTAPFSDWEHADTGQYVVSTSLPIPLRVAYMAYAVYPDLLDLDVLNGFHQGFVDDIYSKEGLDITDMEFILVPEVA